MSGKKQKKADDGLSAPRVDSGLSALQAYREDVREGVAQPHDGTLIAIATLLHQASYAAESEAIRDAWLAEAVKRARELLGPDRIREGQLVALGEPRTPLGIILLFAEFVEDYGHTRLAGVILEGSWPLARGRKDEAEILANCSRNERMLGNIDLALEQAKRAYQMAEDMEDPGFKAMLLSKVLHCWRNKGDLTKVREHIELHTELCVASKRPELIANAHFHVGAMLGYSADNEGAMREYWEACKISNDPRIKALSSINLALILFDFGYPREAKALASSLLSQPLQRRYALTGLAAYALSSGILGEREDVEWAYEQVVNLPGAKGVVREYVVGLNACGEAFEWLGDPRSASILAESRGLMDRYSLNDLKFRKELLELHARARERRRQPMNPVAEAIRKDESIRPERVAVLA
jgi:tetratricopeptide (TPR) repeat protein